MGYMVDIIKQNFGVVTFWILILDFAFEWKRDERKDQSRLIGFFRKEEMCRMFKISDLNIFSKSTK